MKDRYAEGPLTMFSVRPLRCLTASLNDRFTVRPLRCLTALLFDYYTARPLRCLTDLVYQSFSVAVFQRTQ